MAETDETASCHWTILSIPLLARPDSLVRQDHHSLVMELSDGCSAGCLAHPLCSCLSSSLFALALMRNQVMIPSKTNKEKSAAVVELAAETQLPPTACDQQLTALRDMASIQSARRCPHVRDQRSGGRLWCFLKATTITSQQIDARESQLSRRTSCRPPIPRCAAWLRAVPCCGESICEMH